MRIAVIDDEKYAREELIHQIRAELPNAVICEADSGVAAVELLERESFDLLFLDIHMGDMKGTTLAALARRLMPQARIVFATAFAEYGVQAFELGVDNYLLKPFDPKRVRQVLQLCTQPRTLPAPPKKEPERTPRIAVTVNRRTLFLNVEDIAFIETSGTGHHCVIHTAGGEHTTAQPLGEFERRLEPYGFFRIHKTCLVQLKRIEDIFLWSSNGYALHIQGCEKVLPIGRERVKELRKRLNL